MSYGRPLIPLTKYVVTGYPDNRRIMALSDDRHGVARLLVAHMPASQRWTVRTWGGPKLMSFEGEMFGDRWLREYEEQER